MGLDIVAYSHLRFSTDDPAALDDEGDLVFVGPPDPGLDRLGGMRPGVYARTLDVHVWWYAEHATYAIPNSEVAAITERIAQLRAGTLARACPGDLAVLADAPPVTEEVSFRAGSYSGYNRWREHLSRFAHGVEPDEIWSDTETYVGKPFFELIHFSDAEGTFGTAVAAKLAEDFRAHAPRRDVWAAAAIAEEGDRAHFAELYDEWQGAFELAAQGGCLIFC